MGKYTKNKKHQGISLFNNLSYIYCISAEKLQNHANYLDKKGAPASESTSKVNASKKSYGWLGFILQWAAIDKQQYNPPFFLSDTYL